MEQCYVFEVLHPIGVRSAPSVEDEFRLGPRKFFSPGDAVSVDLVIHETTLENASSKIGPYLRLSDGSGWLFVRNGGTTYLEELSVEQGLWSFYVDNEPAGLLVRNHPMDQLQDGSSEILLKQNHNVPLLVPMQKVFCDRRVQRKNGVNFYRVQGASYSSWIFDQRIQKDGDVQYMIHPEDRVKTGLFAYQAQHNLAIRYIADVDDDFKTSWSVEKNELIVCDIVKQSRYKDGNGPFLRLADGTGWLFEHKEWERMMTEVPIEEGRWKLQVKNSQGIQQRKQPMDNTKSRFSKEHPKNEVVVCDRKISAQLPGQASFYRVEGTATAWIFDRRGDVRMAKEIEASPTSLPDDGNGWNVEFVRGVAAAALQGLKEIAFNYQSCVISFRHPDGTRINVYYTTRTIGTTLDNPNHGGKSQLFRRNCKQDELIEILKNPRAHTDRGYFKASSITSQANSSNSDDVNMEEDFRNRLKDLDEDIHEMIDKRKTLLESIQRHGRERLRKDALWWKQRMDHESVLQAEIAAKQEAKRLKVKEEQRRREQEQLQRERTCTYCGREFVNPSAMQNHLRDVHEPSCSVCGKCFRSRAALSQHMYATGHW